MTQSLLNSGVNPDEIYGLTPLDELINPLPHLINFQKLFKSVYKDLTSFETKHHLDFYSSFYST